MPELPEVETLVRQLKGAVINRQIKKIEILRSKSFVGDPQSLVNLKLQQITRIGKLMIVHFEQKWPILLIHLKMTGQLIFQPTADNPQLTTRIVGGHPTADWINQLPSKHTRVIITFTDKSVLYFNDQRVFGWLKLVYRQTDLDWETKGFMGLDPLAKDFDGKQLSLALGKARKPIKTAILEQHKIAGLGNIYANDALFLANIHPQTQVGKLKPKHWQKLAQTIQQVLFRGIELGGASQTNYVHLNGMGGSYQNEFLVYKQDKKACPVCGKQILKIKLGGRGTFYCPKCQPQY